MTVLFALLGALLFRIRGGFLHLKDDTEARILWSLGLAVMATLAASDPWLLTLAPAFFLGAVVGWYGSIDLGHNEGTFKRDCAVITARGLWFTLLPGAVLWLIGGHWWFMFSGISTLPAYVIGWAVPARIRGRIQPTEIGEALTGAAIGAVLALSLSGV